MGIQAQFMSLRIQIISLEINVEILGQPGQVPGDVFGCVYRADRIMSGFSHFLLNGTIRLNVTGVDIQLGRFERTLFRTTDFKLTSYAQRGFFQCVIFDPLSMKTERVSNSSDFIKLPGTYSSHLIYCS